MKHDVDAVGEMYSVDFRNHQYHWNGDLNVGDQLAAGINYNYCDAFIDHD